MTFPAWFVKLVAGCMLLGMTWTAWRASEMVRASDRVLVVQDQVLTELQIMNTYFRVSVQTAPSTPRTDSIRAILSRSLDSLRRTRRQ